MNSVWAESKLFHDVVPTVGAALYSPKLVKNGQAKIWGFIIANNSAAGVNVTIWTGATSFDPTKVLVPGCLVGAHELWVPPIVCYLGYAESIYGLASAAGVTLCLNGGVRQ